MAERPSPMRVVSARLEAQLNQVPQTTAFQKLLILLAFSVFVALASLTASLPLPLPGHQDGTTTNTINDGDTAWIIVATIFGLLASVAAVFLFSSLFNLNTSSLAQKVLVSASAIAFIWVVLSFALVHGKQTWGDKLLGFPIRYYMFAHLGARTFQEFMAPTIPSTIFAVFELCFAIIAPTIIASAVSERVSGYGFLAFIFVWHICIYCPVAFITWNENGWLYTNDVEDFSGGIVTNQLAAITILVLNRYLDWKKAPTQETTQPVNEERLLISGLVFWFLSFGLNAGKAHAANSVAAESVVNTIAAVLTSILLNFFWVNILDGKVTATEVVNAILIGLVSSTPSSGYVTIGGSMVITIITFLVVRLYGLLFNDGLEGKPLSFAALYGLGGAISFLFTGLICYAFVNGVNGLTHGYTGSADVIRYHTATVLTLWTTAPIAVAICAFLVDLFVPLSKGEVSSDFAPTPVGPFRAESVHYTDVYQKPTEIPQPEAQADATA